MTDCLCHSALPSLLQDAARRLPRKSPRTSGTRDASRQGSATQQIHTNNYLAEARPAQTSPLGGRNRRGAGAPLRNRNACHRAIRQHTNLKKRLLEGRLRLLVLSAAVAHVEKAFAAPPKTKITANNYVAEEHVLRGSPHRRRRALSPPDTASASA